MKIVAVRVTPIAIKDPPLLNAAGVHEPSGLRSIIEVPNHQLRIDPNSNWSMATSLKVAQKLDGCG